MFAFEEMKINVPRVQALIKCATHACVYSVM